MDGKQLFDLLRKEAECSFCIHPVNKPKILPCLHSFCLECLNKYAASRRQKGHTTFDCPECLVTYQLPDNDKFDAFQTTFYQNRLLDILVLEKHRAQKHCDNCEEKVTTISYCFECQTSLCPTCLDAHRRLRVSRAHRTSSMQNAVERDEAEAMTIPSGSASCDQQYHEKVPLEYYCENCRVCICHKCALVGHSKHSLLDIPRVAEECKQQIVQQLEHMKSRAAEFDDEIKKSKKYFETTRQYIEESRHRVQATVDELIRVLKEQEANIMRELDKVHQKQEQAHLAQLNNFEQNLAKINSVIKYAEANITNTEVEIIQKQSSVSQWCDKLLSVRKTPASTVVRVGLITNDGLCQTVRDSALGRVVVRLTDLSCSVAEGKGLQEAECGEIAAFTVITIDAEGQQCYDKTDQVTVHIQAASQEELEVTIEDKKDGIYSVAYMPQKHGQHHVTVDVCGQKLSGSPWNVHVTPHQYQAISSFGSAGTGKGQFNGPRGISVSSTGNIAVADAGNKRVQVLTPAGEYLTEFGQGTLRNPASVAYSGPDNIIVLDKLNPRIRKAMVFTESGTFLRQFGLAHIKRPWRVFVANDGRVVVCDQGDVAVKVLSPDGKELLQSFSAPEYTVPPHYAVYHKEKFFVSYYKGDCIKVFDEAGKYLHDIGCGGTEEANVQGPRGIAVDKFGNLLILDETSHRLRVFTAAGEFVSWAGGQGTRLGQFTFPEDIAVSKDSRVYITDLNNGRVQIFV